MKIAIDLDWTCVTPDFPKFGREMADQLKNDQMLSDRPFINWEEARKILVSRGAL